MHKAQEGTRQGARIATANLTKQYKNAPTPAVVDTNLVVEAGEFMTLLGPSGSGKTTTLNMIAGFESITRGTIHLDDRDITQLRPHQRDLGMVFQNYALFPHLTARQNIAFPLRQRKVAKNEIQRRVDEVLDLVHLGQHGHRLPSQLSGGQQQRVALARAVVYRPRALLLDEPLGALDKKLRENLQLEISRLHRELGITFVFVTHDQEEALALSDRIAVFNEGRIEQVGTPKDLYEQPKSHFVATFLGDSNVFEGTYSAPQLVLRDGSKLWVEPGTAYPLNAALIIRPERLRIGRTPVAGHNVVRATVTEVVYQGAFRRVLLRFQSGEVGQVRDTAVDADPVLIGQQIEVSWAPHDAVVVAAPTVPVGADVDMSRENGEEADLPATV